MYQANIPPMTNAEIPGMCHSKYMLAHRNEATIEICRAFQIIPHHTITIRLGEIT